MCSTRGPRRLRFYPGATALPQSTREVTAGIGREQKREKVDVPQKHRHDEGGRVGGILHRYETASRNNANTIHARKSNHTVRSSSPSDDRFSLQQHDDGGCQ